MTLADLKRGDRARIDAVDPVEPSVRRLMVLGLVEGAELECLGGSLGGDPIEMRIHGGALSLRRADARRFRVTSTTDTEE